MNTSKFYDRLRNSISHNRIEIDYNSGLKTGKLYATMTSLVRTKQGITTINDAYTLDDIRNNNYKLLSIYELDNNKLKVWKNFN